MEILAVGTISGKIGDCIGSLGIFGVSALVIFCVGALVIFCVGALGIFWAGVLDCEANCRKLADFKLKSFKVTINVRFRLKTLHDARV